MKKKKIKVGFTEQQHQIVHEFLKFIQPQAEKELVSPVQVRVDWSDQNDVKAPHVFLKGKAAEKTILIKDILEADDKRVLAPLHIVKGGSDVH